MKRSLPTLSLLILVLALLAAGCMTTRPPTATPPVTATPSLSATPTPTPTPTLVANLTADEQRVQVFVNEAVAYAKANGREKALAEFNNPNGSFVRDELYVFAVDYNGTCLATPAIPDWVGTDRFNEKDTMGQLFIQKEIDLARNGGGFITVHFVNPAHAMAVEPKLCYVHDVDGTYWIGSGIYNPGNMTVKR